MNKSPYDKDYFDYYGGQGPYDRSRKKWISHFKGVAERIKEKINPKKVLDVGCAKGFLVESLRNIGIEAWGIDVSDYAISQVHESVRDYFIVKSAIEPFEDWYDLVVCMEVVEHLSDTEDRKVIENICSHTNEVLFSSNPFFEHPDESHRNVRPKDYWIRLFAENGFILDKEFDASFVAPFAMRFIKKKLDITFVSPGGGIAGGIKIIFEYCNRLSMLGHNLNLVLLSDDKIEWFKLNPQIKIIYSNYDPTRFKRDVPNADILIATWWETAPLVALCPDEKGRKYYLIQHYESAAFSSPEHTDYTYRLPLNKIVVSSWLKTIIEDISGEKCEVILSGIDFSQFHPIEGFRKQYALDHIRIGMIYSPDKFKGFDDGTRALEIVKRKYPQVKIILMGVQTLVGFHYQYDEYYKSLNQQEIKKFYNSLDIFVSPSRLEGFYLPGLEAMGCGIIVIATDAGGNRDYAIHGQTALVSTPGIPDLLAKNIIKAIEDKVLTDTLRENGLKMASQFTWEKAIKNILRIFIEGESNIRVSDPKQIGLLVEEIYQTKRQLWENKKQIEALLDSWSWRITSPLRWIYRNLIREGK